MVFDLRTRGRALFLILFTLSLGALRAGAAEKDFSSWRKYSQVELIAETESVSPGAVATVGLRIRLADKWHTYWLNPGDSGTPLRLSFNNSDGVKVTRVLAPAPKRFETGPLISFGYEREVVFPIELDIAKSLRPGDTAHVEADAEWLVCEDVCIPAFQKFTLDLPVSALEDVKPTDHFSTFQRVRGQVPQIVAKAPRFEFQDAADTATLLITEVGETRDFVDFFPFKNSGLTNEAPQLQVKAGGLELKFKKGTVPQAAKDRTGVLVTRRKAGGQIESWQFGESGWSFEQGGAVTSNKAGKSLWWMLLSAFLGGLILNLMPCVFPILSMKLLSLLKQTESHASEVRANNLAYVAGVLVSFLAIAALLSTLRSAGHLIGWGFQLQSPVFLALLCWLFFALSLNLLGVFEIDFFNAGVGQKLTRLGGWMGSFFTGVLAVVVASPCTAPFMGVALGFGLGQPTPVLMAVFLSLGLGLAFPYLLFAVFPSWIRVLPRPGVWMMRVKQVMAFPLLATLVWLLWILGEVRGSTTQAVVLLGCVLMGFAFWLSAWRRTLAIVLTVATLLVGLVYIDRSERAAGAPRAGDELWEPYSPARLEALRGRNVFVNMTADWCLTCKVNERLVFSDPDVIAALKARDVIWLKGDWTQRNEDITLFLNRYERVGVPFYVLYSPQHPNGQVLPEVLSKSSFIDWIEKTYPKEKQP